MTNRFVGCVAFRPMIYLIAAFYCPIGVVHCARSCPFLPISPAMIDLHGHIPQISYRIATALRLLSCLSSPNRGSRNVQTSERDCRSSSRTRYILSLSFAKEVASASALSNKSKHVSDRGNVSAAVEGPDSVQTNLRFCINIQDCTISCPMSPSRVHRDIFARSA